MSLLSRNRRKRPFTAAERLAAADAGQMQRRVDTVSAIRRYERIGILSMLLMLCGLGGWAVLSSIQGAVIAPATVVVESNAKSVQHLEGGIVAEIAVRNGDRVEAGQLLVRLDQTEAKVGLQIIESQLEELYARRSRLLAEQSGNAQMVRPWSATWREDGILDSEVWSGQQALLESRIRGREGRVLQIQERIAQLDEAVRGLEAQNKARQEQAMLNAKELEAATRLEEQRLVNLNRLTLLQREASRIEGEIGSTKAEIARTKVQISETRAKMLEDDQAYLSDVISQLREAESKIAEGEQRRVALQDRLKRTMIVAPRSGIVHNVQVHTVGGVIAPREGLMQIVPVEDTLVIEGKIAPADVDRVTLGQEALVRFQSMERETTPELRGIVSLVSPDLTRDGPDKVSYFLLRVRLPETETRKLGARRLLPGMPAEIFVQTGERTALSYLLKPIVDQVAHAWRER
jgi:HlyD family secretion protein